jgi:serine/threonine protein kinase
MAPCDEADTPDFPDSSKEAAGALKTLWTTVHARIAANRRRQQVPITTPLMFRNDPVLLPLITAAGQDAEQRYSEHRSNPFSPEALDPASREWSYARSVGLEAPIARLVHIPSDVTAPVAEPAEEPEPPDSVDSGVCSLPSTADSMQSQSGAPSPEPPELGEMNIVISDWLKDFSAMETIRTLAPGRTGKVELRKDSDGRLIAVKSVIQPKESTGDFTDLLMREVETLVTLRHPCIVTLVGYSLPTAHHMAEIGMEYAENGDLGKLLQLRAKGEAPAFADATGMAIILCGIVHGMRFLHANGAMHRNLKPSNILIDGDGHAKIGDFSKVRPDALESTMTQGITQTEYTAPEIWQDEDYTPAVDAYSFALIMYEILAQRPAFPEGLGLSALYQKVTGGERPPIPAAINAPIEDAIEHCWSVDPAQRYSFADLAELFSALDFEIAPGADADRVEAYVRSLP